jgi:hypothetical protein
MAFTTLPGIILNIIIVLFVLMFADQHKHRSLFFLLILSTLGDVFGLRFLGPDIRLAMVIGAIHLPITFPYFLSSRNNNPALWAVRFLIFEYLLLIILGIVYGFIFPWNDPLYIRNWSQAAQGRTIITWFREIGNTSIILYVAYIFALGFVKINHLVRYLMILSTTSLVFSLLSSLSPVNFVTLIWGVRDLEGRFYGWFGEPKEFGKTALMAFMTCYILFLIKAEVPRRNLIWVMIVSSIIMVLSASTSTIFIWTILLIVVHLLRDWTVIRTLANKYSVQLLISVGIVLSGYFIFSKTDYFEQNYKKKFDQVLKADYKDRFDENEPLLFTRWEIWDRTAANFLWRNPRYILHGVGPNLIHIPATKYKSKRLAISYRGALNSVPKMGWLFIISRSGIAGLACWIIAIIAMLSFARREKNKLGYLFIAAAFTFFLLTVGQWFYVLLGVGIGVIGREYKLYSNIVKQGLKPGFNRY